MEKYTVVSFIDGFGCSLTKYMVLVGNSIWAHLVSINGVFLHDTISAIFKLLILGLV